MCIHVFVQWFGKCFQTTQGNRLSCRDQEGRRGSEEAVPGPSMFPSGEPGVSGDFWAQGPGVCKLPKPPASRALCQAKRAPRAAFPRACLAAQTKRWAEGIRVPAPLAGPREGGAWWATVHGVAESQTRLNDFTFTFHLHALEREMATHSSILGNISLEDPQGQRSLAGCSPWGR